MMQNKEVVRRSAHSLHLDINKHYLLMVISLAVHQFSAFLVPHLESEVTDDLNHDKNFFNNLQRNSPITSKGKDFWTIHVFSL